jgi:hypothetical protein
MELKKCPFCGKNILLVAKVCKHCSNSLEPQKDSHLDEPIAENAIAKEVDTKVTKTKVSTAQIEKKPIQNVTKIILIVVLAVVALIVFGSIYYYHVYLPAKIDREASRYFSFANLNLRSSKDAGGDYNKIGSIPYGVELITYERDGEWSYIKYKEEGSNSLKGYVSSAFLLNKEDFIRLNSIFGDIESKGCISTAKCRLAILNYFKEKGYIGKISSDILKEILPNFTPSDENQWQIFCRDYKMKPNNVLYPQLYNKNSKFTDFAVIIKNISNAERRLLLFYFEDNETPHLFYEEPVYGNGYIVNISTKYDNNSKNQYIVTKYSD